MNTKKILYATDLFLNEQSFLQSINLKVVLDMA